MYIYLYFVKHGVSIAIRTLLKVSNLHKESRVWPRDILERFLVTGERPHWNSDPGTWGKPVSAWPKGYLMRDGSHEACNLSNGAGIYCISLVLNSLNSSFQAWALGIGKNVLENVNMANESMSSCKLFSGEGSLALAGPISMLEAHVSSHRM